jgi:hypothetical protein
MTLKMLTEHFSAEELKLPLNDAAIEAAATELCTKLLEPIRAQFAAALIILSAYRNWEHNLAVGGEPTSYHLYDDGKAAADFIVSGIDVQRVFDWIRLLSGLPFDQVILEYRNGVPDIVHIQLKQDTPPRRMALVGQTHGTQTGRLYEHVEVR